MNKLKLLFLGVVVFAFGCNNSEQNDTENQDTTNVEIVEDIDVDNEVIEDEIVISQEEIPDESILKEEIPQTNGIFSNAGIDDDEQVYVFVRGIRANIGNINTLSGMINYPIFAKISGERAEFTTSEDFIENFDLIFNEKIRTAINNVDYNNLFSNYQGVMIGDGEIWMSIIDGEMKIIAINN